MSYADYGPSDHERALPRLGWRPEPGDRVWFSYGVGYSNSVIVRYADEAETMVVVRVYGGGEYHIRASSVYPSLGLPRGRGE